MGLEDGGPSTPSQSSEPSSSAAPSASTISTARTSRNSVSSNSGVIGIGSGSWERSRSVDASESRRGRDPLSAHHHSTNTRRSHVHQAQTSAGSSSASTTTNFATSNRIATLSASQNTQSPHPPTIPSSSTTSSPSSSLWRRNSSNRKDSSSRSIGEATLSHRHSDIELRGSHTTSSSSSTLSKASSHSDHFNFRKNDFPPLAGQEKSGSRGDGPQTWASLLKSSTPSTAHPSSSLSSSASSSVSSLSQMIETTPNLASTAWLQKHRQKQQKDQQEQQQHDHQPNPSIATRPQTQPDHLESESAPKTTPITPAPRLAAWTTGTVPGTVLSAPSNPQPATLSISVHSTSPHKQQRNSGDPRSGNRARSDSTPLITSNSSNTNTNANTSNNHTSEIKHTPPPPGTIVPSALFVRPWAVPFPHVSLMDPSASSAPTLLRGTSLYSSTPFNMFHATSQPMGIRQKAKDLEQHELQLSRASPKRASALNCSHGPHKGKLSVHAPVFLPSYGFNDDMADYGIRTAYFGPELISGGSIDFQKSHSFRATTNKSNQENQGFASKGVPTHSSESKVVNNCQKEVDDDDDDDDAQSMSSEDSVEIIIDPSATSLPHFLTSSRTNSRSSTPTSVDRFAHVHPSHFPESGSVTLSRSRSSGSSTLRAAPLLPRRNRNKSLTIPVVFPTLALNNSSASRSPNQPQTHEALSDTSEEPGGLGRRRFSHPNMSYVAAQQQQQHHLSLTKPIYIPSSNPTAMVESSSLFSTLSSLDSFDTPVTVPSSLSLWLKQVNTVASPSLLPENLNAETYFPSGAGSIGSASGLNRNRRRQKLPSPRKAWSVAGVSTSSPTLLASSAASDTASDVTAATTPSSFVLESESLFTTSPLEFKFDPTRMPRRTLSPRQAPSTPSTQRRAASESPRRRGAGVSVRTGDLLVDDVEGKSDGALTPTCASISSFLTTAVCSSNDSVACTSEHEKPMASPSEDLGMVGVLAKGFAQAFPGRKLEDLPSSLQDLRGRSEVKVSVVGAQQYVTAQDWSSSASEPGDICLSSVASSAWDAQHLPQSSKRTLTFFRRSPSWDGNKSSSSPKRRPSPPPLSVVSAWVTAAGTPNAGNFSPAAATAASLGTSYSATCLRTLAFGSLGNERQVVVAVTPRNNATELAKVHKDSATVLQDQNEGPLQPRQQGDGARSSTEVAEGAQPLALGLDAGCKMIFGVAPEPRIIHPRAMSVTGPNGMRAAPGVKFGRTRQASMGSQPFADIP